MPMPVAAISQINISITVSLPPPGDGIAVLMHQDEAFWRLRP